MCSCGTLGGGNSFDSDKLVGKYKVDISPLVSEVMEHGEKQSGFDALASSLAGLALSSIDMTMSFYKNNKGLIVVDGKMIDVTNAFSDEKIDKINEFTYKVENDSILYFKNKNQSEYRKWCVIRSYSENYDYLEFIVFKNDEKSMKYNLMKISE